MRTAMAVAIALGLVTGCAPGAAGGGGGPGAGPPAADTATDAADREIRELTASLFAAQSRGDLEAVAGFFHDDAALHVAGSTAVRGAAEIRAFYGRVLGFLESAEPGSSTVDVAAAGDMAYDLGRLTTSFRGGDAPRRFEGRYLIVWRRGDEGWKIAALALTSEGD